MSLVQAPLYPSPPVLAQQINSPEVARALQRIFQELHIGEQDLLVLECVVPQLDPVEYFNLEREAASRSSPTQQGNVTQVNDGNMELIVEGFGSDCVLKALYDTILAELQPWLDDEVNCVCKPFSKGTLSDDKYIVAFVTIWILTHSSHTHSSYILKGYVIQTMFMRTNPGSAGNYYGIEMRPQDLVGPGHQKLS